PTLIGADSAQKSTNAVALTTRMDRIVKLLAALLELRRGSALLAVHRLGHRVLFAGGLEPGPAFSSTQPRERLLGFHRVAGRPGALQLLDGARELGVLPLERRLRSLLQLL